MESYTAMSDDAMSATVTAMLETREKYPMELNGTDFTNLMYALQLAWHHADAAEVDREEEDEETMGNWIMGFVSSIGETLGVEHI